MFNICELWTVILRYELGSVVPLAMFFINRIIWLFGQKKRSKNWTYVIILSITRPSDISSPTSTVFAWLWIVDASTIYIAPALDFLRGPAHPSPLFRSSNTVWLWLQKRKFKLKTENRKKYLCSISDQLFRGPRCPWPRLRLPGSRARQRRSVQSLVVSCI